MEHSVPKSFKTVKKQKKKQQPNTKPPQTKKNLPQTIEKYFPHFTGEKLR